MNTRAKGTRNRSQGLRWLKEKFIDIIDTYTVPESRYSKDAFGVADAFIVVESIEQILPVQFKSNEWGSIKDYNKWFEKTGIPLVIVRKDDRKGFRIRVIGYLTVRHPFGL